MRRSHILISTFLLVITFASGCNFFAPPAAEQTLIAGHGSTATYMSALRGTATAQGDSLSATLETAQTAVSSIDLQSTSIAATLMATGMPLIDVRNITPLYATPVSTQPAGSSGSVPSFAITPVMNAQGGAQGNSELLAAPPATSVPEAEQTVDPSAPHLSDIVMTTSVGADDCPTGTTTVFPTNAEGVYVSAVAHNLSPANVVVSHWLREGMEAVQYEWSSSFDIDEGCIWFYLPALDVDFSAANWSVQIDMDGRPAGTPVTFTITGTSDVMSDNAADGDG
jgi:hypothetical protein